MTRNANINLSLVNGYHPLDSHWLLRAEAWLRPPAGCARVGSAAVALRPPAAVRGFGRGEGCGGAGHEPARAIHHLSRQCLHNHRKRIAFNCGCRNTHRGWRTPIPNQSNTHGEPPDTHNTHTRFLIAGYVSTKQERGSNTHACDCAKISAQEAGII